LVGSGCLGLGFVCRVCLGCIFGNMLIVSGLVWLVVLGALSCGVFVVVVWFWAFVVWVVGGS
jgi:hypothetical protein